MGVLIESSSWGGFFIFRKSKISQSETIRQVARTLGEELQVIQRLGFSIVEPEFIDPECDMQEPQVLDWDATDGSDQVISFYEFAA